MLAPRSGKATFRKSNEAAIWCTSCGAFESPHGASTKATFDNACKGNPRKWAGPSRCKQLERLRQGIHPTIDIPLGPEITCKSDACNADHTKLTTEQMARRRAWDKATRRKTVSTKGKDRAPSRTTVDDDFFAEALVRADERNPIFTSEDELKAAQIAFGARCCRAAGRPIGVMVSFCPAHVI